ncbi:unnamed protein product [Arabidopsis arenosa]|uniref:Cytochrome P450 n=1 Tax=Arabidopsis arenosa TaxID=38785 RepID=A0A8S1ZMK9_ARAAE|nr:unnamed protein product [Arabidopsis arenosa]
MCIAPQENSQAFAHELAGPWYASGSTPSSPYLSGMDILLTVDPVNIHYILSSNFANYPKGMEFKKIFEVVGDSIFNVDSGLWEDMRNSSHAIFSHQDSQRFWVSTSVNKLRQGLVPILENAADKNILVDFQDLFQRFLFDTSLILMTGHVKPVFLWRLQYWIGVGVEKRLKLSSAARDTTSSVLTWFFWLLSKNPEAMNKIRQEVNKKMPRFDPADLDKLVYLHSAVCETLRLYPPVPFNHKSPAKPDMLPRFQTREMDFIQWKMKTVAAEIIRNYKIKVVDGHKTEPIPSVLFRMQHGLKVNITKI